MGKTFLGYVARNCDLDRCTVTDGKPYKPGPDESSVGHSDTVSGGPVAIGLGLGMMYHLTRLLAIWVEARALSSFGPTMLLGEWNAGLAIAHKFERSGAGPDPGRAGRLGEATRRRGQGRASVGVVAGGGPGVQLQAHLIQARVLPRYPGLDGAQVTPLGRGLVNQTYLVSRGGLRFVLQRLNPVFCAAVNDNIDAVTRRLAEVGMVTPRLVPAREGSLSVDLGAQDGLWRLQTYVDGVSFDVVASLGQARAAGCLVARFHRALDGLDHEFAGMRAGVHDTAHHLARLREALEAHTDHRLLPRGQRAGSGSVGRGR